MKRSLKIVVLSALVSCLGTGCFTACTLCPMFGGSPDPAELLIALPLDALTLPVQIPLALDGLFEENCLPWFYSDEWDLKNQKRILQQLDDDFDVVLHNPRFLQRFDTNGVRSVEFHVLQEHLKKEGSVSKLSTEQAVYLAEKALEDLGIFPDLGEIWTSKNIGRNLRLRALEYLHYMNWDSWQYYSNVFGAPCFSDAELEGIMMSTSSWAEQRGAVEVLRSRISRKEKERKAGRKATNNQKR